jgi:DNA-binding MarR family transcriptional regulator
MSSKTKTTNSSPLAARLLENQLIGQLRETSLGLVRRDGVDLSARQLAVFLTVYTDDKSQTVRGLALRLDVSKPAITRAVDRLVSLSLVQRKPDNEDRRSIFVKRTSKGAAFLREVGKILIQAESTAAREEAAVKAA